MATPPTKSLDIEQYQLGRLGALYYNKTPAAVAPAVGTSPYWYNLGVQDAFAGRPSLTGTDATLTSYPPVSPGILSYWASQGITPQFTVQGYQPGQTPPPVTNQPPVQNTPAPNPGIVRIPQWADDYWAAYLWCLQDPGTAIQRRAQGAKWTANYQKGLADGLGGLTPNDPAGVVPTQQQLAALGYWRTPQPQGQGNAANLPGGIPTGDNARAYAQGRGYALYSHAQPSAVDPPYGTLDWWVDTGIKDVLSNIPSRTGLETVYLGGTPPTPPPQYLPGYQQPGVPPAIGTGNLPGAPSRTLELYGRDQNGTLQQLYQELTFDGLAYHLKRGGSLWLASDGTSGYSLSGTPGQWAAYYPGSSPANYGLDSDTGVLAWDGRQGRAVDSSRLERIFGSNWRAVLYASPSGGEVLGDANQPPTGNTGNRRRGVLGWLFG